MIDIAKPTAWDGKPVPPVVWGRDHPGVSDARERRVDVDHVRAAGSVVKTRTAHYILTRSPPC